MFSAIKKPINQILGALPDREYQRLYTHLKPVILTSGEVLLEPNEIVHEVYFPEKAMISLVSIMMDGVKAISFLFYQEINLTREPGERGSLARFPHIS